MQFSDMQNAINDLVDEVVPVNTALLWLNEGKNIMNRRGNYNYPDITSAATDSFAFPAKYHNIPVLYAAQKYQEQNMILDQAKIFQQQFEQEVNYFLDDYSVPPQYWDNDLCQQFTATANQLAFVITKNSFDPKMGNLRVYVNNRESFDWQQVTSPATYYSSAVTTASTTTDPNGFIFNPTTVLNAGDAVTATWEEHSDWTDAPFPWQSRW